MVGAAVDLALKIKTSEHSLLCSALKVDGPFSTSVPTALAGHPERTYHALVAGSVGGYFVWGNYSSVNHQIIMYLVSRVFIGLSKRAWEKYSPGTYGNVLEHPRTYSILSAALWGVVMVLFEDSPHVLHRSLKQSMDEIYRYQVSSISDGATVRECNKGSC